jgi:hypothetical protein
MAAEKNHMEAIYNIGLMLEQGTFSSSSSSSPFLPFFRFFFFFLC